MITMLVIVLVLLWFFGYVRIDGINLPDTTLFSINNLPITLWDILILVIVSWAISIIPTPFREIAGVILILWVLSVLGVIALAGVNLASIFVIAIIIGLIVSLFPTRTEREHTNTV